LTDGQGRALLAHRTKELYEGYAKRNLPALRSICAIALNGRNRRGNLSFSEFSSAMRSAKLEPLNRNVERVFDPSMKDKH